MPFKSHVDEATFKTLPEPVQKEYSKTDDGSYMIQIEGVNGYGLENVAKSRGALESERALTGELKTKLKGLEGLDVVKAREALAKLDEIQKWTPDQKVQEIVKQKESALTEKFTIELTKEQTEKKAIYSQLERALIDGASTAALAKHKGNIAVLLPHMRSRSKLVQTQDGGYVTRFVDESGKELLTRKPNSTDYMGAEEFVDVVLKKDPNFMPNFEGVAASGFNLTKNTTGTDGASVVVISSADARDTVKYRRARAEADKAGKRLIVED